MHNIIIRLNEGLNQKASKQIASITPSNEELNPICHLLALLGAHHILHVSRIRVNTHNNTPHNAKNQ